MNRYKPHLLIVPEDEACGEIASAFVEHLFEAADVAARQIRVEPPKGGWLPTLRSVETHYEMGRVNDRYLILVIDFDRNATRRQQADDAIRRYRHRTIVVGALSNPEDLCRTLGMRPSEIGRRLAKECTKDLGERSTWSHELLAHNEREISRMPAEMRDLLFPR